MQSLQQNEFYAKTTMESSESLTAPLESKSFISNYTTVESSATASAPLKNNRVLSLGWRKQSGPEMKTTISVTRLTIDNSATLSSNAEICLVICGDLKIDKQPLGTNC